MAPNANKPSRFYLLRFYLLIAVLLTSCGYPLRTPPFLNGELEGIFCPEGRGGHACVYVGAPPSEDTLPAMLDVRVENWSPTEYTFSGTLEFDGTTYTVSGREEGSDQNAYLLPQAVTIGGEVNATLTDEAGMVYQVWGYSHHGWGGGLTPEREKPFTRLSISLPETLPCESDFPCTLGTLLFPDN